MSLKNCVYCGKEITARSREHVIQNALGGSYKSTDICCPECNNYISYEIDEPFVQIFNPILANIDNLRKNNHKSVNPAYTGFVEYEGQQYEAHFRGTNIMACPELNKKFKCNAAAELPLRPIGYNFKIDNLRFQNGMSKIALNYALAQGVAPELITSGLNITKSGNQITRIDFEYPTVQFYPLNSLDNYLELNTPMQLYHNLILFSDSNYLWCYVDLFNTFQYYVLLTDKLPANTNIYTSYLQTIQYNDTTVSEININRPKDAWFYAQQYGVEPSMDAAELTARIQEKLAKTPHEQPMEKVICKKAASLSPMGVIMGTYDHVNKVPMGISLPTYFDDEDNLRPGMFRAVTPTTRYGFVTSYPDTIAEQISHSQDDLKEYTTLKFMRMNAFLCNKENQQ